MPAQPPYFTPCIHRLINGVSNSTTIPQTIPIFAE